MPDPFIQVYGPQPCFGNSASPHDASLGYHAFFVTFVPFLPSFLSDDFTRMITGEVSRIKLVVSRQIRFLNDLSSCKTGSAETFDLRFVSIPQAGQPYNNLHIFFIGKVFDEDQAEARRLAVELWRKFCSFFPLEDPFNYPLHSVMSIPQADGTTAPSEPDLLALALEPLKSNPQAGGNLIEIRKYEDRDPMLGGADDDQQFIGYFPHPFRPTIDFSAMSRFLETFAVQPQKCVASICLRPTALTLEEQQHIDRMMQHYKRLWAQAAEADNWLALYRQERFADLQSTFDPIVNQRKHLFMVKIQIQGEHTIPQDVVAALGSEIMNNSTNEPRLWNEAQPSSSKEMEVAQRNFRLMEYQPWQRSDAEAPLWRLSSLVTSFEAVGAFRLPVPPESGHMPGVRVQDEPFVLPPEIEQSRSQADVRVSIGRVIHRGTVTETQFYVSLSQLKRHGLVAGSTGSGKTNTCLHLLTQLWRWADTPIPFLVIYPIDKPDYRLLQADKHVREKLLIFTLGDDTTSPFRFNPFEVPAGILVRTHISLLMRAFSAAFSMWDPLPAVYRAALRRAYEEAGFQDLRIAKGGDAGASAPLLSRFYEILVEVSEEMTREYGREAKGNIRQGAEIRMRDLLQNAGHVLNVREGAPWDQILRHPTVMEVGRVGSTEDSALVMGFLLMSLSSFLASRRKGQTNPEQHITLIEEAHRLMSSKGSSTGSDGLADPRAKASEDFANILAEVRGFGEGILIAEQIPTELVSGAIGNTYLKIMHWLEEQRSFELFADIMSLNKQQREYTRTLPTGQAVLRGFNGRPVLVKVDNYLDQFQYADDTPRIDDSDQAVREFMEAQVALHSIRIPQPVPFTLARRVSAEDVQAPSTEVEHRTWGGKDGRWVINLPMQTCAFCEALYRTRQCEYGSTVRKSVLAVEAVRQGCLSSLEAAFAADNASQIWQNVEWIGRQLEARFWTSQPDVRRGIVYCYLAHEIDNARLLDRSDASPDAEQRRQRARAILERFEAKYVSGQPKGNRHGN